MRRFIVGFFAADRPVLLRLIVVGIARAGRRPGEKPSVTPLPGNILLTVDLTQSLPEGARRRRRAAAPRRAADLARFARRDRARRQRSARQGAARPRRRRRARPRRRSRKCATRSPRSAPRASSRSPSPTASASSARAPAPITSPPPSTRSGCSRWANVGLIGFCAEIAVLARHARPARHRAAASSIAKNTRRR